MKWKKIESSEDLPKPAQDVLLTDGRIVHVGWLELYSSFEEPQFYSLFEEETDWVDNITHWMPLPKPPGKNAVD